MLARHTMRACVFVGMWVGAASGAAAPALSGDSLQLEEVVVTATRVGELDLLKTPMAMSVISPDRLDQKGLGGISDFVGQLPSVNMQSLSPGENEIEMRGLVTNAVDISNVQQRPLVALYLDDAAITQQGFNPDLHVYDLERIEIIRGPQGTLYGAGSMAGTIRLITKKPDARLFSASGDASVSETQGGGTNYSIRGVVNLPIIENRLASRLTAYRSSDSGYIDNVELNRKDANPAYSTQVRLALRWSPVESLTLDASAALARLNVLGRNGVFPELGDYTYASLTPEQLSDSFNLYNVTADWDLSFAHLISSSSYLQRQRSEGETFQYINEYLLTPGFNLAAPAVNFNDVHQFQQEIRLVSRQDQRLRWIVGAYFERYSRFYEQNVPVENFDAVFGAEIGNPTFNSQFLYGTPAPNVIFYGTISVVEKQFAPFGEATYAITPKLDLTLGVRQFNFKDDFSSFSTGIAGAIAPGEPLTAAGTQKSSGANPRGVLSYRVTDDVMVYGEAARGFRYGGVNNIAPVTFCAHDLAQLGLSQSPLTFGPDNLWSYTIGEKSRFGNGRVLFNVDGFYIDWRDVQTIHHLECGYYFTENDGKVRSLGLEFDSKFRVTSALTMGFSGSFTDAAANGPIDNLGAADGGRTPYFPRVIASLSGNYDIPLGAGKIGLSADYTYRSNAFTEFSALNRLYREIPDSKMLNASIGYVAGRWSATLYGTNLTDDHLVSTVQANTFPGVQPGDLQFWGRPRTIGVHLHFEF